MASRVIIGERDGIETELGRQNICTAQESQGQKESISERKKQDHMAENDDELWVENEND